MKKIIALMLAFTISLCFVGCGANDSEDSDITGPSNIAVGIQSTRNCASIAIDSALEAELEDALLENGSQVQIYEIDGDSYRINQDEIKSDYKSGLSKNNRQTQCDNIINRINKIISSDAVPVTPEVDILGGLTTLTNAVNSMSYSNSNAKQILLVSNMLSTSGVINFAESSIYIDLEDYANFVSKEMPDMAGVSVTFFIADADDDQQEIPNSDKERLKSFYQAIINGAGGSVKFAEQTSSNGEVDKSSWPAVTTVDIRNSTYSGEVLDVTLEESVLFKSDSTEWIDEQAAEDTLSSLVDAINDSDDEVVVAGSTATTSSSEERHIEFSLQRANKVKDMLIDLGADSSKLIAIGIGKSYERYRVPDSGQYANETNHSKNRCVFITSASSDKGKYFLDVAKKFSVNGI